MTDDDGKVVAFPAPRIPLSDLEKEVLIKSIEEMRAWKIEAKALLIYDEGTISLSFTPEKEN